MRYDTLSKLQEVCQQRNFEITQIPDSGLLTYHDNTSFKCKICGYEWTALVCSILQNKNSKCRQCAQRENIKKIKSTHSVLEKLNNICKLRNLTLSPPTNIPALISTTIVHLRCNKCSNTWSTLVREILRTNASACHCKNCRNKTRQKNNDEKLIVSVISNEYQRN